MQLCHINEGAKMTDNQVKEITKNTMKELKKASQRAIEHGDIQRYVELIRKLAEMEQVLLSLEVEGI